MQDKQPKTEEVNGIYPGWITWSLGTRPLHWEFLHTDHDTILDHLKDKGPTSDHYSEGTGPTLGAQNTFFGT